MDLSTAGLISTIKLNALLPDGMFEDSDIVSFLNDAFFSDTLHFMMKYHEDFYITYTDYSASASLSIPTDAIAQKLKSVQLVKGTNSYVNLPRLSNGEITSNRDTNLGFYIQDNTIIFYPNTPTDTIRLIYYKRPYYMIDSADDTVYKVTSISGNDAILNKAPTVGSLDLTLSKSYQPFDIEDMSGTGSITTNNHITLSAANIAKVTVGDYFCPEGYTAFPKIPMEAGDVLQQGAILKAMIAMKDKDGFAITQKQLEEAKKSVAGLISPRIDNSIKKIVNTSSLWGRR